VNGQLFYGYYCFSLHQERIEPDEVKSSSIHKKVGRSQDNAKRIEHGAWR